MSFGGAVAAMVATLKNNTRSKRNTLFDIDLDRSEVTKLKEFSKLSPEQLKALRLKLQKENKIRDLKLYGLTLTFVVLIFAILHFSWKYLLN